MKRFDIFNLEEEEIKVDAGSDASVISDVDIETGAQAETELVQEVTALEEVMDNVDTGLEVQNELEEQVSKNEELMESGSPVTADQVAVAQEEFYKSLSKLGPISDHINISRELSDPLPLSRLRITVEDQKGIIATIIEKIKAFFKAIKDFFVKILQKIGILKEIRDKKIRAAIEKIKSMDLYNLKPDDIVITDKLNKYLNDDIERVLYNEIITEKDAKKPLPSPSTFANDLVNIKHLEVINKYENKLNELKELLSNLSNKSKFGNMINKFKLNNGNETNFSIFKMDIPYIAAGNEYFLMAQNEETLIISNKRIDLQRVNFDDKKLQEFIIKFLKAYVQFEKNYFNKDKRCYDKVVNLKKNYDAVETDAYVLLANNNTDYNPTNYTKNIHVFANMLAKYYKEIISIYGNITQSYVRLLQNSLKAVTNIGDDIHADNDKKSFVSNY